MGLSKALYGLGHRVKVSPAQPVQKQVKLSVDDFDLVWRAVTQLGRYLVASDAVEHAVISFNLQNKAVVELIEARRAIDADVLELIGWEAE